MASLNIDFPTDIDRILVEQLNFASIVTRSRLATLCRNEIRAQLPKEFIIRNTFTAQGIKSKSATKSSPNAVVYANTDEHDPLNVDYLTRQAVGGTKIPYKNGKLLAIPNNVKGKKSGIIAKENRPKALLETQDYRSTRGKLNRVFAIYPDTKVARYRHKLAPGIYINHPGRQGRHKAGKENLTRLYVFSKTAQVKKRFTFIDTAKRVIAENKNRVFAQALREAVRTAR